MKQLCIIFILLLVLTPVSTHAQRFARAYERGFKLIEKEKYFKAANAFIDAYNADYYPGYATLSLASMAFILADEPEFARECIRDAERNASFFYYYFSASLRDREVPVTPRYLKGKPLYDSLFMLNDLLKDTDYYSEQIVPSLLIHSASLYYVNVEQWDSSLYYLNIGARYLADPEIFLLKGDIFIETQQPDSAARAYRQALDLDPGNSEGLSGMGEAYELKEEYDNARKFYEMAASRDTSDLYSRYCMAYLDYTQYKYSEALKRYREILSIDPDFAPCYFDIGQIYFDLEEYEKAIEMYRKYLEYEPGDEITLENISAAEYNMDIDFY
jgi:tetratricopeptide (TPR) repeat protein